MEQRRRRAFQAIQEIVKTLLQRDPQISKIVLFASLAREPERLRLHFDIDLAVRCSPEKYYALVSAVLDPPEFKVDFLDLDATTGLLKQRIIEEGIILYEA